MNRSPRTRVAATLIEVLVVVAMIAVLVGLLLVGVQRVRAAAARTQCQNHLKQIGLALHQYHDIYNGFPPGVTTKPGAYQYLNWLPRILPFIEQSDLWQRTEQAYRQDPNFLHDPPHTAQNYPVKLFACPSDSRVARPNSFGIGMTSYVGVQGRNHQQQGGVMMRDHSTNIQLILDGTSSTLMVGERPPSGDDKFGFWYAGWGQDMKGSAEAILGVRERMVFPEYRTICRSGPYMFKAGSINDVCDAFHFWSLHGGGANFLLADGSVKWLSYSANDILVALSTMYAGEIVTLPD